MLNKEAKINNDLAQFLRQSELMMRDEDGKDKDNGSKNDSKYSSTFSSNRHSKQDKVIL